MFVKISAALFAVLTLWSIAEARHVKSWSYEELNEGADVVVIVAFESTEGWGEPFDKKLRGGMEMAGQLTTFAVKTVLKRANAAHFRGNEIQVVHYKAVASLDEHGERSPFLINAPHPLNFKGAGARYMLFLKTRKDGKFEPVSGLVDSGFSVMLLKPEREPSDSGE